MTTTIYVTNVNESFLRVDSDYGTLCELSEYFTFYAPGYKHQPKYRAGVWDGKIRLFSLDTLYLPKGLLYRLRVFAKNNGYLVDFESEDQSTITAKEVVEFIKSLNLPDWLEIRDYQVLAILKAIKNKRILLLSPTSSGKSFIQYVLYRYYNKKTLLLVPRISLLYQMESDFKSYGFDGEFNIIGDGHGTNCDKNLVISTWQSIKDMPRQWFSKFDVLICDEVHGAKSTSMKSIAEKCFNAKYKIGVTGTLDDEVLNQFNIEGSFGPTYVVTTNEKLMKEGHTAQLSIKPKILVYPQFVKDMFKGKFTDYKAETNWLIDNDTRTKYITDLAISLPGNGLVFFNERKHGQKLYNILSDSTDRTLYYIDGTVKGEKREDIRKSIDAGHDSITISSYGTTSTGVSVRNINWIIFASSYKSKITVLQTIGRGLRKSERKTDIDLYDIVDDLSYKSKKNFTFMHFDKRLEYYVNEKFSVRVEKVML